MQDDGNGKRDSKAEIEAGVTLDGFEDEDTLHAETKDSESQRQDPRLGCRIEPLEELLPPDLRGEESNLHQDTLGDETLPEIEVESPRPETFDELIEVVAKEGLTLRTDLPDSVEQMGSYLERATRVPLEVYVRVVRDERVARALTRDISTSGLFLSALTLSVAEPGDQVLVEIVLPGQQEPMWAQARVTRVDTKEGFPAIGLAFERLAERDNKAIEDYVASRAVYLDV